MKYCSNCGKELGSDMVVCPHCGTKIEDAPSKAMVSEKAELDEKSCPYCGKLIPSVAVACPYCGKKISKTTKKSRLFLIVALLVVGCIIIGLVIVRKAQLDKMENTYSQAQLAMDAFDYEQAQQLLNSIPEYKDAQELLQQAQDGEFMSLCAQYIYNFIQDGGFYNPSAVRLLDATYLSAENDDLSEILGADGILYITIQGTNKLGGTLSKDYVIFIGGDFDGVSFENEDKLFQAENNYDMSEKPVDVALVNKMLQKYWADMGIS